MTENKRKNNRANNALRNINIIRNYTKHAEGSVLIHFGDTHVLCTASVINKVPSHVKNSGKGWITAEYGMLPRSTNTRMDRESAKGKQSGRTQEIQRLIGRSLRNVIDLSYINEYTIHIDCDVIQADGGTRTASITGAWVALHDALNYMLCNKLLKQNNEILTSMPELQHIAAVSIGMLNDNIFLDLDYSEDSACDTDLNLVLNQNLDIIEIQGTAEGSPLSMKNMYSMVEIASNGITKLFEMQKSAILNNII
jgi:ribonuclease PH